MSFTKGKMIVSLAAIARQSVDDSLKNNASNASGAGLEIRVSRMYDGVGIHDGKEACQWCLDRCGTNMPYQEALAKGVFQRHPGCGCVIEYIGKKGIRTVQTGKFSGWNFADELEKRKSIGLAPEFFADELMSRAVPYIDIDTKELLIGAENGKIYGGTYKQAMEKPKPQLEKSIRSHIKEAELHEWKIQHPEKYMVIQDAQNKTERRNAIRKWERDRRRNSQQAVIEIEVWRLLYG